MGSFLVNESIRKVPLWPPHTWQSLAASKRMTMPVWKTVRPLTLCTMSSETPNLRGWGGDWGL